MSWKFTDATEKVAMRVLNNGATESCLASSLPQGTVILPYEETPEQAKARLVPELDNLVASIYGRWTRFEAEYELRESEARAYKDVGYTGDVPRQVAAFADRAGVPYQQATDLILSQAAILRTALANLGDLRMRKYEVINAPDAETAQNLFNEIKALIEVEAENIA